MDALFALALFWTSPEVSWVWVLSTMLDPLTPLELSAIYTLMQQHNG